MRRFAQVDVFSDRPLLGNPVAVVMESEGLSAQDMTRFAQWTNLSETAFVLPAQDPAADYRLRIFTAGGELPFAGHPTLGAARAWLDAGGACHLESLVIQESEIGLITIRRPDPDDPQGRFGFLAPPMRRTGPVEDETLDGVVTGLGITRDDVVDHQWVDNGPGALALLLKDPGAVLSLRPEGHFIGRHKVGVAARYPHAEPGEPQLEVRYFAPGFGIAEDPVTGSFNAGLGQWLTTAGHMPPQYEASQGQLLGRRGRVHVSREGDDVWVSGATHVAVRGEVDLPTLPLADPDQDEVGVPGQE